MQLLGRLQTTAAYREEQLFCRGKKRGIPLDRGRYFVDVPAGANWIMIGDNGLGSRGKKPCGLFRQERLRGMKSNWQLGPGYPCDFAVRRKSAWSLLGDLLFLKPRTPKMPKASSAHDAGSGTDAAPAASIAAVVVELPVLRLLRTIAKSALVTVPLPVKSPLLHNPPDG